MTASKVIYDISLAPPRNKSFWDLFDHIWFNGIGMNSGAGGIVQTWTARNMENALEGVPDQRTIEYWQAHSHLPSLQNLIRLSTLVGGHDPNLQKAWLVELATARRNAIKNRRNNKKQTNTGSIEHIRICDRANFDFSAKKCRKHIDVFPEGIDELYLSFDFHGIARGTPFERWWIRNGERISGRSSYYDESWPGYTFWRPKIIPTGEYVVRIVAGNLVETQVFSVHPEGHISRP